MVPTPATRTIEQLCAHLGCEPQRIAKTLVYLVDDALVAVVIRGDLTVNEVKLGNVLAANQLRLATEEEVRGLAGRRPGRAAEPKAVARSTESAATAADDEDEDRPEVALVTEETDATDYVDGSEDEHRHLSKAERKRLKKLARMQRASA